MSQKTKGKVPVKNRDSESEDDAPDFDKLLKMPPSTGSHFMLKSEEKKFQELQDVSKSFKIDIELLNLAMSSIPFNERYDLKTVDWTSSELEKMKQEANTAEGKYQEALLSNPVKSPMPAEKPQSSIQKPSEKASNKPKTEKESMQNWLDDILDL